MLRCYGARKLIVSCLYGELDEAQRTSLEAHLKKCPRCAQEMEARRETLQLVDRVRSDVEYPERFEELFPAMVRGRIEIGDVAPSFGRPARPAAAGRQFAYSFSMLLLGVLIGSSAMLSGGLRSAHYRGLVEDARQLYAVREAIDTGDVLDTIGALKAQLAAEGRANLFKSMSTVEAVALDIMESDDEEKQAVMYLARAADEDVVAGNYAKASDGYNALIEQYPDSVLAKSSRRMVAFIAKEKLGDYPQAIRQFRAELAGADLRETTERALFDLAETCVDMGELDNAAASYELLVERFPRGAYAAESMLKLGDLYLAKMRDFQAARETYYELAARYADDVERIGALPIVETRLAMLDQSARYGFKPMELFLEASGQRGSNAFELYENLIHNYPNTVVARLALDEMSLIEWYGSKSAPLASINELPDEQRIEALRKVIARCERKDVAAFAHMAIGDIFRDKIVDLAMAEREYQQVLDKYPEEGLRAAEAQERIDWLFASAAGGSY
jgi:TolA-binding protein